VRPSAPSKDAQGGTRAATGSSKSVTSSTSRCASTSAPSRRLSSQGRRSRQRRIPLRLREEEGRQGRDHVAQPWGGPRAPLLREARNRPCPGPGRARTVGGSVEKQQRGAFGLPTTERCLLVVRFPSRPDRGCAPHRRIYGLGRARGWRTTRQRPASMDVLCAATVRRRLGLIDRPDLVPAAVVVTGGRRLRPRADGRHDKQHDHKRASGAPS
jgi:hypothetical protein